MQSNSQCPCSMCPIPSPDLWGEDILYLSFLDTPSSGPCNKLLSQGILVCTLSFYQRLVLHVLEILINEIIKHIFFCIWLLSLNIMFSKLVHTLCCVSELPSFLSPSSLSLCDCTAFGLPALALWTFGSFLSFRLL